MKKQILSFALVAAMVGAMLSGCSSEKKAGGGADSTGTDSSAMMAKPDSNSTMRDTSKKDTSMRDTTKKVPQ